MTQRAQITTPWVAAPSANHPLLADAFALDSWSDITGQLASTIVPAPNTYTVEVLCPDATLALIRLDVRFVVLTAVTEVLNAP